MGIQNNIKLSLPLTGHTAHNALPGLVTPDRLQGNHRVFHDPGINPEQLQTLMEGNQKGILGMFNVSPL